MSSTFSPEEIIQANQLRSLSQKELQNALEVHEKLGVYFSNKGLSVVMMQYQRYKALVERLEGLEEKLENMEFERAFGHRANTPVEHWIEQPEGMSTLERYRQHQKDGAKE